MKRLSLLLVSITLCSLTPSRAQDAATEERLNKLSGQIEDLIAAQRAQQKQLEALVKEIDNLRDQASKPTGNYATPEDLKRVAEAIKDVDRKRLEDAEKISTQLAKLGKTLAAPPSSPNRKQNATANQNTASTPEKPARDEKGYPYTIRSGDTLSLIVQAYREKNIKVSTDAILKANPGLRPERLKVGQEIWIPAPQS